MKTFHFYFDFISPYSYLAITQLPAVLEETPCKLNCIPVLFAALLNAHGQNGPAEIPVKRRYTFTDCLRWARSYGVPFQGPPTHPFNPLASLRMTLALENPEQRWEWIRRVVEACWAEGKDISDPEMLLKIAEGQKLDFQELWQKANTPEIKEALKRSTDEAIQKGVFGVPSFLVDGELFWGNDRLPFLKAYLKGELRPMDERIDEILSHPSSARRQ